jgi:hypothetical protein
MAPPESPHVGDDYDSPSAALMDLVGIDRMADFEEVVQFLMDNLDKVIQDVHSFDKLLIDNGTVQLNCPPAPEPGDTHGSLLLKTLSETLSLQGAVSLKREFRVHDLGVDPDGKHKIEIREDVVSDPPGLGQPPVMLEHRVVVSIARGA